jgi:hypothetical protein
MLRLQKGEKIKQGLIVGNHIGIRSGLRWKIQKVERRLYRLKDGKNIEDGKGFAELGFRKRLYSVTDLVTEIGGTEWYWRSQVWNGNLPYIQVGKKYLIDSRDIEEFIKKNKYRN